MQTKEILFNLDEQNTDYTLVESAVKEGNGFEKGSVLYSIKSFDKTTKLSRVIQILAEDDGQLIDDYCCIPGTEIEPGMILCRIKFCSHSIVISGICSQCGKTIVSVESHRKVVLGGLSRTLHLSKEEFLRWRSKHNEKLLKEKKLVLVLDLDNTLLETFCDNSKHSKSKQRDDFGRSLKPIKFITKIKDSYFQLKKAFIESQTEISNKEEQNFRFLQHCINKRKLISPSLLLSALRCPASSIYEMLDRSKRSHLIQNFLLRFQNYSFVKFTLFNDPNNVYYVKTRPYVKQMICSLAPRYHLYVYTLGKREYAKKVLEILGLDKILSPDRIVCGEDSADICYKELSRLVQCDERFVVVLDDRVDVWGRNLQSLRRVRNYSFWKEFFIKSKIVSEIFREEKNLEEVGNKVEKSDGSDDGRKININGEKDEEKMFEALCLLLDQMERREEQIVRKITSELENLHLNCFSSFSSSINSKLNNNNNNNSKNFLEEEGKEINVGKHLDKIKNNLFRNITISFLSPKELKVHEMELQLHGANHLNFLGIGDENLKYVSFFVIFKSDLCVKALSLMKLNLEKLKENYIKVFENSKKENNFSHHNLENIGKEDWLPIFIYYEWFEYCVGEMSALNFRDFLVDEEKVIEMIEEAINSNHIKGEEGKNGIVKDEGGGVKVIKKNEEFNNSQSLIEKELEKELESSGMFK